MAEINKKELYRAIGYNEPSEHWEKLVSIVKDKKQYSLRIPVRFAEEANIDPKRDVFVFHLIPLEDGNKTEFTIKAELVRNGNAKKT